MSQESFTKPYPGARHAWAQYDFLALYQNFVDEDISPFEAQTYVINQEYLQYKDLKHPTVKTAVDFPLHQYLPAQLAKILPGNDLTVLRIYMSLYFCAGLFFLFLILKRLSQNPLLAFLGTLLFGLNGVLLYYHNAYIPSVPALSNILIGIYFLLLFKDHTRLKHLLIGLFFLSLAVITRTTFFISWFALFLIFIYHFRNKYWAYWVLSFAFILFFQWYKYDYAAKNATLWLGSVHPIQSLQEYGESLKAMWQSWLHSYWSSSIYFGILLGFLGALILTLKRKEKGLLLLLFLIHVLGSFMFIGLLPGQFHVHDYYGIDIFLVPFALFLMAMVTYFKKYSYILSGLFLWAIYSQYAPSKNILQNNFSGTSMQVENKVKEYYIPSINNQELQEQIAGKTLFIPADFCPNARLSFLKRPGYVCYAGDPFAADRSKEWDFDYMLTDVEILCDELYTPFNRPLPLQLSHRYDHIYLFEKTSTNQQDVFSFLHDELKPLDSTYQSIQEEYTDLKHIAKDSLKSGGILVLDIETTASPILLVCHLGSEGKQVYYKANSIEKSQKYAIYIPSFTQAQDLSLYFWNPERKAFQIKLKGYQFTALD